MDPCKKENDINTLLKDMAAVKTENKTLFKKVEFLESVYRVINDLSKNVAVLAEQMKDTKQDVEYIRKEVDSIKEKPGDNYNTIKIAIVTAIIGAIIGALVSRMF